MNAILSLQTLANALDETEIEASAQNSTQSKCCKGSTTSYVLCC